MAQALTLPMSLTDPLETILQGCRRNDRSCQEQLYRYCYPEMISICLRYAGDQDGAGIIFNNTMLRVFKHIHSYHDQGKFLGWIKSIAVNCSLDFIREQNKFRPGELTINEEEAISIPEEVFDKISARDIQDIIRKLPKATAVVFNLFVYEGFTHKQISKALHIAEGTSKWHVNEGRKLVKAKLENFFTPSSTKNAAR